MISELLRVREYCFLVCLQQQEWWPGHLHDIASIDSHPSALLIREHVAGHQRVGMGSFEPLLDLHAAQPTGQGFA